MEDGKYVDGSIYFYAPNKAAPVFFAAAFLASTLLHAWQCVHYRSWQLTGLYVFGGVLFTAGYVLREVGAFHYDDANVYIASVVLVYAAPPLLELANYMVLGRVLYYVPHLSPIHPGRVLTTFAALSSVVEALNANGAAYSANPTLPAHTQATGRALLKAALVLQVVVVALFLLLAAAVHRRAVRARVRSAAFRAVLRTLYASEALLLARTLYRVVEFFRAARLHPDDGGSGSGSGAVDPQSLDPVLRYEWFFYVFEAALMLANVALLNLRHPRRYLPASTKTYLAPDGAAEVTGPGYKDDRHFLLTLFDPFDLVGLARGRDDQTRFWEQPEQQAAAAVVQPADKAGV